MFTLIRLAFRNVLRNKSRAGFTVGAIGFGVLMTMLLGSFIIGLGNAMIDDVVQGKVGALQVHRKGYDDVRENQPLDLDFAEKGDVVAKIQRVPGVTGVSPRLVFSGMAANGSQSTMIIAIGFDPNAEYQVLPNANEFLDGKPLDTAAANGAIFGLDLANALDLKSGSAGTIQAAAKSGQQNALDFELRGTLNNGNAFESKRSVMVPLKWAQELLGMQGRVTELAVATRDRDGIEDVAAQIRTTLGPGYEVQTWKQLRPNVDDVVNFQRLILGAICSIFLVIAVIGVVNTMLMAVLERTREIGTMMAVGMRRGRITVLFLWEAVALAVLGTTGGMTLALAIIATIIHKGGVPGTAPGSTAVYHIVPAVPMFLLLPTLLAAGLGTILAGVYPSWRAARLNPVDALRAI
jgi:putative ABC transport system permease protein